MIIEWHFLWYIYSGELAILQCLHISMAGSFGSVALREEQVIVKEAGFSHSQSLCSQTQIVFYFSPSIDYEWKQQHHLEHKIGSNWWSSLALITNTRILSSFHAHVDLSLVLATFHIYGKMVPSYHRKLNATVWLAMANEMYVK